MLTSSRQRGRHSFAQIVNRAGAGRILAAAPVGSI
jgi:hypothetical protein